MSWTHVLSRRLFCVVPVGLLALAGFAGPASADVASPAPSPAGSFSPVPIPIPTFSSVPVPVSTPAVDSAAELVTGPTQYFVGTQWTCETFGGLRESHEYVASGGSDFVLHIAFLFDSNKPIVVDERYAFDAARRSWTVSLSKGSYFARSYRWGTSDWTFTGWQRTNGIKVPFRVKYHPYDQGLFRRDFQTKQHGRWITFSGETCEQRDAPEAR
jgi:hypothetical protein